MRISGLASGFDTDEMVRNLMRVERMRVDRYTQRKQINTWRQERYNAINKDMANFILNSKKNMGINKVNSTGNITTGSFKNLDYIRKAVSSDESMVGAKVVGKSTPGSFNVKVEQLAENASYASDKIEPGTLLEGDIEIAGVKVHSTSDGRISVEKLMDKIGKNEELKGKGISAFYDKGTKTIFLNGEAGTDLSIKGVKGVSLNTVESGIALEEKEIDKLDKEGNVIEDDEGNSVKEKIKVLKNDLEIDGKTIKAGTNIKDIAGILNKDNNIYKVSTVDEDGVTSLKVEKYTTDENKIGGKLDKGQEAKVTVNGVAVDPSTIKENKFVFNGVELDLKSVTGDKAVRIEVSTNTDEVVDKVKELVNDYNALLDKIALATGEKRYHSYHPLSQEEKKEMTEDDIKLWEEKAKSGMLNNDETLNRMTNKLRNDLYNQVDGVNSEVNSLFKMGITTEKYSKGAAGGKLQIDEEKLRAAIEKDAEGVMETLFGGEKKISKEEEAENRKNRVTNKGIFTGIYDNLIDGMKDIVATSGPGEDSDLLRSVKSNILIDFVTSKGSISDIDKMNNNIEREIENLEKLLIKKEDAYYAQFTQMEKYIYEMNSQSNWLMQQMM